MGGTSWPVQGSPLRYGENYTLDQRDTGSLSSSHCLSTPRHLAHLVGIIHLVGLVLIDLLVHLGNFVLHVLNILKDVDVKKRDLRKNRQLFWQESSYLFTLFLFFYVPGSMNILLVKYQYLEAQISGKFVKQKKVGEYLVFSLFSYRQQRPPPLSLSNHYHLLFCKSGLGWKTSEFHLLTSKFKHFQTHFLAEKNSSEMLGRDAKEAPYIAAAVGSQGGENNCKLGRKSFLVWMTNQKNGD